MSAGWLPPGKQTFVDAAGKPLVGGLVYHYVPGTDDLKDTWQDPDRLALNENPIRLDERGQAMIWGAGSYRQRLTDAAGATIWDRTTVIGIDQGLPFYNTVTDAQAATIADGVLVVLVGGYRTAGDGGGAAYAYSAVVPGHSAYWISANGKIFVLSELVVFPEMLGAYGDGIHNDAIPLQNAVGYANVAHALLRLTPGKTYSYGASLSLPSGLSMDGYGAVLSFTGGNVPGVASKGYLDGSAPTGRQRIRGLRISCSAKVGALQHGFVVRDFWGIYEDIEVLSFGGDGIHFDNLSAAGGNVGGTLVENRIVRPTVRLCDGIGIFLGPDGNNKLTDGYMGDAIVQQVAGSASRALYVGSAAGWNIQGGHTYGASPATAIEVRNSFFTRFGGYYVEGYTTQALYFAATQNALDVGENRVNAQDAIANSSVVRIGRSAAFTAPRCTVGVQNIRQANNIQIRNVLTESAALVVQLDRPRVDPNAGATAGGSAFVTPFASLGANTDNIFMGLVGRMTNIFTDTPADGRLAYNGMPLPNYNKAAVWSGVGAQSIDFAIPVLKDFDGFYLQVAIYSRTFHNGGIVNKALYSVYVKSKLNGTDAWTVQADLIPLAGQTAVTSPGVGACVVAEAPTGFTVPPVFSITTVGSSGTLNVAFTSAGPNPFGEIFFGEISGRASH